MYLCPRFTTLTTKNMKKIATLIMAVALVLPISAQSFGQRKTTDRFNHSNLEQYYGLRLGLNVASLSSDLAAEDLDSRSGFAFGFTYGLQLANSTPLFFEASLYYSEKGGETTMTEINDIRKIKSRLTYVELPLVVKYSFDVYDDLYIQPFLGGYLALGIGGKTKYFNENPTLSYADPSFDNYNRFDGGLRVGCGAEYQMIYAELGFDFGLANISDNDVYSTHTRNFFINVGVNF